MTPKGILIPIGGGEDKDKNMEVLRTFLKMIDKKDPIIEIMTTATNLPREVGDDYKDAFRSLDVRDYDTMHIEDREEADDPKILDRLGRADGIFFTGGDQSKLSSILAGTKFSELLMKRYEKEHFVIAGTSAGAAAMSETIIVRGSSEDSLLKGELDLTVGFGFLKGVVVDTHFTQRGRFGRLIQAVATNPALLGIGLGEDTGAVITEGNEVEIIGSGLVVIVDGNTIKHTNLNEIKEKEPLSVNGVTLHVLCPGDKFLLKKRKFIYEKE